MFKIIAFFMIKLFTRLFVGIDILLSCRKHLDDRFISLRMEVWVHKASLSPNMFLFKCLYRVEESESCIRAFRLIDFASFYEL